MTCDPDGSHLLFFYRAPFGSAFPTELKEMYLELFPLGRHWVYIFNLVCSSQQHSRVGMAIYCIEEKTEADTG